MSPEDWDEDFNDFMDGEEPIPESMGDIRWRVQIEYADHTTQEIVSDWDYLSDRPEELHYALLDYFKSETDDFSEEDGEEDVF